MIWRTKIILEKIMKVEKCNQKHQGFGNTNNSRQKKGEKGYFRQKIGRKKPHIIEIPNEKIYVTKLST